MTTGSETVPVLDGVRRALAWVLGGLVLAVAIVLALGERFAGAPVAGFVLVILFTAGALALLVLDVTAQTRRRAAWAGRHQSGERARGPFASRQERREVFAAIRRGRPSSNPERAQLEARIARDAALSGPSLLEWAWSVGTTVLLGVLVVTGGPHWSAWVATPMILLQVWARTERFLRGRWARAYLAAEVRGVG